MASIPQEVGKTNQDTICGLKDVPYQCKSGKMFYCIYSFILLLEDMGVMLNCTVVSLKTYHSTDNLRFCFKYLFDGITLYPLKEWRSQPILTQVVGMGRSNRLGGANFLQLSLFFPIPHPPCCMHLPSQPATPHIAQPTNQTETC